MAVKMVSLKCPNCGSNIMLEGKRKACFCTYCGAQLYLDDTSRDINITHNYNYTYRSIDETKIGTAEIEAELEKSKKKDEDDKHGMIVFGLPTLLFFVLAWAFIFRGIHAGYKQEDEFKQLIQEIETDISNKDYDAARVKANKYTIQEWKTGKKNNGMR